jgi:outer membrane protein assembly factor BamB
VWSGIDALTGELLWQTMPTFGGSPFCGASSGPVTTANGVVFGCALDPEGHMYALNGATGAILWTFASGGSCLSGAAISEGRLFWGVGLHPVRHAEHQALLLRLGRLVPQDRSGRLGPAAQPAGAVIET